MKLNYNQWVCLTGIEILDPDGWDRSKASSFLEDITLREFISRSMMSTLSDHGNRRLQVLSQNAEWIGRALVNETTKQSFEWAESSDSYSKKCAELQDQVKQAQEGRNKYFNLYSKECAKTAELSDKLRVTEQARIGNFKSADQAIKKNAQLNSEISRLTKERELAAGRLDSDSIAGACDCNTNTPNFRYHKPGCKYRLIRERDAAIEQRDEARLKWQEIFDLVDGILKERDAAIEEKEKFQTAAKVLCGKHIGTNPGYCPMCQNESLVNETNDLRGAIKGWSDAWVNDDITFGETADIESLRSLFRKTKALIVQTDKQSSI